VKSVKFKDQKKEIKPNRMLGSKSRRVAGRGKYKWGWGGYGVKNVDPWN
jgi:hypothetical protein